MPFTQPGYVICQARIERRGTDSLRSGDDCINTFVFRNDEVGPGNGFVEVQNRLNTFYGGLSGTQSAPLKDGMSTQITGMTYYMRTAAQAVGTPGEELPSNVNWTLNPVDLLPPELAVCSSYRAAPPYTKSRRGRIFIGPLRSMVNESGIVSNFFKNDLIQATKGLASVSPANPVAWVIASRKNNSSALIEQGYVDRAFDVIRGRDPNTEGFRGRTPSDWTVNVT